MVPVVGHMQTVLDATLADYLTMQNKVTCQRLVNYKPAPDLLVHCATRTQKPECGFYACVPPVHNKGCSPAELPITVIMTWNVYLTKLLHQLCNGQSIPCLAGTTVIPLFAAQDDASALRLTHIVLLTHLLLQCVCGMFCTLVQSTVL